MVETTKASNNLSDADRAAILDAAGDFVRKAVAPRVERPEVAVSQQDLAAMDALARSTGILPHPGEPGFALWEPETPLSLSLEILRMTARSSAGVAYRFHLAGLYHDTAVSLGIPGTTAVISGGGIGLGKGALACLLRGEAVSAATAYDLFPHAARPIPCFLPYRPDEVAFPFLEDGRLQWRRSSAFTLRAEPHGHGLVEAGLATLTLNDEGVVVSPSDPEKVFTRHLGLHGLGALAIALGAVEGAYRKAIRYAHDRKQGGVAIAEHAAVRLLLAEASTAMATAATSLRNLPEDIATPDDLSQVFRLQAALHPLLCTAANACMQVFGGYGYMRDYGMEKVVRDCNALRLVGGTTTELKLHIAQDEVLAWR